MHPVLGIPELRIRIFQECPTTGCLATLTQVCHDFFHPAASILWRFLGSLGPLFLCLPTATDYASGTCVLQQEPNEACIARLHLYASFVRAVDIRVTRMRADLRVPTTVVPAHPTVYMEEIKTPKDTRSAHPTTEILRIVIEALGDACLLPNLRELAITGHPRLAHIEEFIQRMIPRNVPCLQYEIRPQFSSSADILVAIESHLTCLTTLTLINHTPRLPSEVFDGLQNLEMLSLARLAAESVTSLARLPRLRRLQILDLTPSDSFILDLFPNSFSSLRELDVQGPMSLVHNILASMPTLQLTTLEIKCYTDSSPRLLCESIRDHLDRRTLRKITLEGHVLDPDTSVFLLSDVEPLLDFPNLTFVMVRSYGDMIEPAISAERLARAWPLLEQLCIQGTYSHSIAPLWCLQDLYAFAKFTPRLRHLTIDFDATNMTAPSFPPLHIAQTQLTHLEILCFSPIGDPDTVASILSSAFPSLHTVMLSELRVMFYDLPYEMDRYNKKWERVAKLLSGSTRVRR